MLIKLEYKATKLISVVKVCMLVNIKNPARKAVLADFSDEKDLLRRLVELFQAAEGMGAAEGAAEGDVLLPMAGAPLAIVFGKFSR